MAPSSFSTAFLALGLLASWLEIKTLKTEMLRAREITLQSTFEHIYQSFQTLNITTPEYTKCIRDEIQGFLVVFVP